MDASWGFGGRIGRVHSRSEWITLWSTRSATGPDVRCTSAKFIRQFQRVVDEFCCPHTGPLRVRSDVFPIVAKLIFTANEMIESVDFPEPTTPAERPVDLRRRVVFPGFALRERCVLGGEGRENVDVIRHYDEISEAIPFAVEVMQAVGDDPGKFRFPQHTRALAVIEGCVEPLGDELAKLIFLRHRQRLELGSPELGFGRNTISSKPFSASVEPSLHDGARHRVDCSPGEETERPRLQPVRQVAFDDGVIGRRVEDLDEEVGGRHGLSGG